ncbi:hypothetical protein K7W42_17785 [Deinococcus sp. HMF7604]|uniref:hypothetical protein n=1 Tax=Deinococcus betulae TaxID=2873312 RepID=UPI001CCD0ECC|nr:hypothetical protein [Deinococcus betulae]MBZ9752697.1 hypothetical protein [Deinococcus betulae]
MSSPHDRSLVQLQDVAASFQGVQATITPQNSSTQFGIMSIHNLERLNFESFLEPIPVDPKMERLQLEWDDVVVSLRNQPMRASVWRSCYGPMIPGSTLAVLRLNKKAKKFLLPAYLACLLKSDITSDDLSSKYRKTTAGMYIKLSDLREYEILIPSIEQQEAVIDAFYATELFKIEAIKLVDVRERIVQSTLKQLLRENR